MLPISLHHLAPMSTFSQKKQNNLLVHISWHYVNF